MQRWAKHRSPSWSAVHRRADTRLSPKERQAQKGCKPERRRDCFPAVGNLKGAAGPERRAVSWGESKGKAAGPDSPQRWSLSASKNNKSLWRQGERPKALEHMPFIGNCSSLQRKHWSIKKAIWQILLPNNRFKAIRLHFFLMLSLCYIKSWSSPSCKYIYIQNDV